MLTEHRGFLLFQYGQIQTMQPDFQYDMHASKLISQLLARGDRGIAFSPIQGNPTVWRVLANGVPKGTFDTVHKTYSELPDVEIDH